MELILIIVILVLLFGGAAFTAADGVLVAHIDQPLAAFLHLWNGRSRDALSVHQSHAGVVYGPRTRQGSRGQGQGRD
jgi:hypothetical protein